MNLVTGLQREPLDADALVARIRDDAYGGLVVFEGIVRTPDGDREIEALEYEAWEERAPAMMEQIAREVGEKCGAPALVAVHRLGRVTPGETAVVCAAAAPHRAEAFAATRDLIDRIKIEVPIWRKEIASDGERWMENP
jgi:molybdopterin synthase catalytic subunit